MIKEITLKYGNIIDSLTALIKKGLSEDRKSLDDRSLLLYTEDKFFNSKCISEVDINATGDLINCIYRRVKNKYGILLELLTDEDINEIMVNGYKEIFIEKKRKICHVDDAFTSELELENLIRMFASAVHREINEANPIVDARLENGYRVNGVLKVVALNGPILTIRKFDKESISMERLVELKSLTKECSDYLSKLVKCGYNIFISGGTSSGKTTFLNALSENIVPEDRVIVIEDSAELKIDHIENIVHMECRGANSIGKGEVNMASLIKTSLRMRPDRIIVGEVRGKEVVDMIQAMNTGHSGSMSTGHGNSVKGMLNRLETMYLMDAQIPIKSIKSQIANAIEIYVHLARGKDGVRKVIEVVEMLGVEGDEYRLNYLFIRDSKGCLVHTNSSLKNDEKLIRGFM